MRGGTFGPDRFSRDPAVRPVDRHPLGLGVLQPSGFGQRPVEFPDSLVERNVAQVVVATMLVHSR